MAVSPLQNFWKPPPVPEMPTVTLTFVCALLNSSATASVIGKTVLEPSIRTEPESCGRRRRLFVRRCGVAAESVEPPPPHAPVSASTAARSERG